MAMGKVAYNELILYLHVSKKNRYPDIKKNKATEEKQISSMKKSENLLYMENWLTVALLTPILECTITMATHSGKRKKLMFCELILFIVLDSCIFYRA